MQINDKVESRRDFSCCAVIPVYNHEQVVGSVVAEANRQGLFCILVDDGSNKHCAYALDKLVQYQAAHTCLVRLPVNQGKGAACMAGFREATKRGFTHALQLDADGQHDKEVIPDFLALAQRHEKTVICGYAVYDHSVPTGRLIGRYITHVWVWINTLSFAIRDSMCGFRIYPLAPTLALINNVKVRKRMDYDPDILVRLYWAGTPVINVPVHVTYPADGVSHFRLFRDNWLISGMHATLFFGMLYRFPKLFLRMLRRSVFRSALPSASEKRQ